MPSSPKSKKIKKTVINDINKIIKTSIESEDTSILPDNSYDSINDKNIQPLIEVIIKNIKLVPLDEKIRLVKIIKVLLKKIKVIRNIRELSDNLLEEVIDYKKLMFLKGKMLFMKNCVLTEELKPANQINEEK